VNDLEKMVDFYCSSLGLTELRRVETIAPPEGNHTGIPGSRQMLVFVGFEEGHRIELVKYHEPISPTGDHPMTATGMNHICFNVVDIEKIHTDLTAQGIEFVTDPIITQDENRRHGIVYARDPEGNWLEFIE